MWAPEGCAETLPTPGPACSLAPPGSLEGAQDALRGAQPASLQSCPLPPHQDPLPPKPQPDSPPQTPLHLASRSPPHSGMYKPANYWPHQSPTRLSGSGAFPSPSPPSTRVTPDSWRLLPASVPARLRPGPFPGLGHMTSSCFLPRSAQQLPVAAALPPQQARRVPETAPGQPSGRSGPHSTAGPGQVAG